MIVDYHTHTSLCKHGEGELEEYILKAIELGLDEIGCSEHIPMPNDFDLRHRMTVEEYYSVYAPRITDLARKYQDRITIKRGLEAEHLPSSEEWVKKFIAENDFDFVIGSVHFLGRWGAEKPLFHKDYEGEEIDGLHIEYFEAIRASAESGMFDIIGHCDLIKKFGFRTSKAIDEAVRNAMEAIKRNNLCIEINTSGLRKPEQETYPSETILKRAKELRIPLTLGSDAHKPQDVGKDFDIALGLIERYGNGKVCVFEKRRRKEVRVSTLKAITM
ncbi:MAG: histidinol-phosphatase HisJ [Ignavibacteriales bacterium]|nr:histidinol-phosphatase HisJ [Ignavibacteriales bacterium]